MKLSIIIPCYNVSQYIQKCIEDIFANDVKDSEIIFVDDGSTDMGGGVLLTTLSSHSMVNMQISHIKKHVLR